MPRTRPLLPALLAALLLAPPSPADEPRPVPPPTPAPGEPAPTPDPDDPPGDDDAPDAPSPPRRIGPVVRSAEKAAGLLRDPDDVDPYRDEVDWRSLPPWQQTSFFGVRARGTFFVFVVDCSDSMGADLRLARAKQELRRCIAGLRAPQRHLVIFFNDRPIPMDGGVPRSTSSSDKAATFSWLNTIDPGGGTEPRGAVNYALGLGPDAVFLLTDGELPPGSDVAINARNANLGPIPIHCIDLVGGTATQLKSISGQSGGRYVIRR